MALNTQLKKNWEKLQEKYNYPVDALGRPIDPKDTLTFSVPLGKFTRMINNMDESFLITKSWELVQKRIK